MLLKKIVSNLFLFLFLTVVISSFLLPTTPKVSAAHKIERSGINKSIEARKYAAEAVEMSSNATSFANAAIEILCNEGSEITSKIQLLGAERFCRATKCFLIKTSELALKEKTKKTKEALLTAMQAAIEAERSTRLAKAALNSRREQLEISIEKANRDFEKQLLSIINSKK